MLTAIPPLAASGAETTWSPRSKSITLLPGKSKTFDIDLKIGTKPVPKVDVLFVFDVTGSMGSELDSAKKRGKALMSHVATDIVGNAHFGVASFCDYPNSYDYSGHSSTYGESTDYPWQLNASIGASVGRAQKAIDKLSIHGGEDEAEDYSRALYECAEGGVGWRDDTKKIVVIFGDAPPHDLSFGKENTGCDPGRDGKVGTDDDLKYKDVVARLKKSGITVIAVNCGSSASAANAFRYAADQTAGGYAVLSDSAELDSTTETLIKKETRTIDRLVAKVQGANASWGKVADPVRTAVAAKSSVKYKVTVAAPADGKGVGGRRIGDLRVIVGADGVDVAITQISVLVRGAAKPTGFKPSLDGYSFFNAGSTSNWAQFSDYYGTGMVQSPDGVHYWAAQKAFEHHWRDYAKDGSCFGMSTSAIALQQGLDTWATMPASKHLADLAAAKSHGVFATLFDGSKEFQLLAAYAPRQCDARVQLLRADGQSGRPSNVLAQLEAYLDQGQPVNIDIWHYAEARGKFEGHSLAAYKYTTPSDNETRVYVYDSNYPRDDDRYIVFDAEHDGWEYGIDGDWDAYKDLLHHSGSEYWSWGKDNKYHDRAAFGGGWKSMSDKAKQAVGGSCLIDCEPVQTALRTGVPLWNCSRSSMEDFPTERISPGSAVTMNIAGVRSMQVSSPKPLIYTGPTGWSIATSRTAATEASYVSAYPAPISVSLEPTSSGDAAVQLASQGAFVGLDGVSGTGISASLEPSGVASVKSTGVTSKYSYSVSREASGSSHAISIADMSTDATGGESFVPSDDLGRLDVVNSGPSTTYKVEVHDIGASSAVYGASGLTLANGDRHETVVRDWSSLASATPLVLIDHGNDGSFDETVTLRLMGGGGTGGGSGGSGGDAGLWILLLGLTLAGGLGWTAVSARRSPSAEQSAEDSNLLTTLALPDSGVFATVHGCDGSVFDLRPGVNTMGRSSGCDIVIGDPSTSRVHATITLDLGSASIHDADSSAGTWVNGERVIDSLLFNGDVVRLGEYEFTFWRSAQWADA